MPYTLFHDYFAEIAVRPPAATKRVPLALPVPRVISTGGASGTRKTCYENKF